jgi:hypothetical protein
LNFIPFLKDVSNSLFPNSSSWCISYFFMFIVLIVFVYISSASLSEGIAILMICNVQHSIFLSSPYFRLKISLWYWSCIFTILIFLNSLNFLSLIVIFLLTHWNSALYA